MLWLNDFAAADDDLRVLARDWVASLPERADESVAVLPARRLHHALHHHLVDARVQPRALVVYVLRVKKENSVMVVSMRECKVLIIYN